MLLKERIMKTMKELVEVPGISGTASERLTSEKIYNMLSDMEYYKNHFCDLYRIAIEGDTLKRECIAALLKGKEKASDTVIITGHYDVVGIDEYGHLKDIAFNVDEMTKRISELMLDENSEKDLKSGEWLFGRGTNDMKFGIALGIELIRELSEKRDFKGNILFLAVSSEESNSEGMLGALEFLNEISEREGLIYRGLLLPEPYEIKGKEDKVRHIHCGTCGKIMPLFFAVGKETHVSEPFRGLNPNLIISEVNRLMECNADMCDIDGDKIAPPPTCLKMKDLKDLYSVQTPIYSAAYYNFIYLNSNQADILGKLKGIAEAAFINAINITDRNREKYEVVGKKFELAVKPKVMMYSELKEAVIKCDITFESYIEKKINEWLKDGQDNQSIAINIIKETFERYPDKSPVIVIAFAPPFYPAKKLDMLDENTNSFISSVDRMIAYAKDKYGERCEREDYYMGICDMSYTGTKDTEGINEAANNMPGLNVNYRFPVESLRKLDIPGVVLGCYGKDFHKYTERINVPYSFDVLPELYRYIIYDILK